MITIIQHTPAWVFALFVALLVLGWRQTRTRTVPVWRATLMPLAMMLWSASRLVTAPSAQNDASMVWLAGFALAAGLSVALGYPRGIVPDAGGRLRIPGSGVPFALMMLLFFARYAVAASLARDPALATSMLFNDGFGLVYGCVSGLFFARTWAALQATTRGMAPA